MKVDGLSMKNGTHSRGDSGEFSRGRGETERKSLELVGLAVVKKAEILPGSRLDRNMEVSILEIYGGNPLALAKSFPYSPLGLHLEFLLHYTEIQNLQIDDGPKTASPFGNKEHTAVEAGRTVQNWFYGVFLEHLGDMERHLGKVLV